MKKKYLVLQEESSDCGVCALLSIIRYYGGNVPLEQLRISSLTTEKGVTAFNLIECARTYGLSAIGIKEYNIDEIGTPFIAHFKINQSLTHFVVVYQVSKSTILIMDPDSGYKEISKEEFYKMYTGIAITIKPSNKIPYIKENKFIPKLLSDALKKYHNSFLRIIILNIIYLIPSFLGSTYISFIEENLLLITIIFIVINAIALLLEYFIKKKTDKLYHNISTSIMSDFFEFILNLPSKYIQLKGSGEIIKRVDDLEVITQISISSRIKIILNMIIIIPLYIILCIIIDYLSIIIPFFITINLIITYIYNPKILRNIDKNILYSTNHNSLIVNYITGISSIFHTNDKAYFIKNFHTSKKLNNEATFELTNCIAKYELGISITLMITELIINIILFINVKKERITLEIMFMINILITLLINSILETLKLLPNLNYKKQISNKIDEMLNIKADDCKCPKYPDKYDIILKDVSYTYDQYHLLLNHINTQIKYGDKVLLIGKNGCGKSTLLKLLIKEYEGYQGNITIGGLELSQIPKAIIVENISYLSQDETLFMGTIRENILLGRECDLTDIIRICHLENLISKKVHGLDTYLYGNGDELSGGEKQLIILARHLVRYKRILIIDEGTSELNNKLEDEILKDIMDYYQEQTLIFVSHKNKEHLFKKIFKLY